MRTVHAHTLSHRFLTESGRQAIMPQIRAKDPADVHPQDGAQSRILALRIIILGLVTGLAVRDIPRCAIRPIPNTVACQKLAAGE
jgi:hypothetical protein